MKLARIVPLLVVAFLYADARASAAVIAIGDSIDVSYRFPDEGTHYNSSLNDQSVVVMAGITPEVTNYPQFDNIFNINFDVDSIYMDYHGNSSWTFSSFNGPHFSSFTGLTSVGLVTNLVGLDLGDITFGTDFLEINWQGLAFDGETFVQLELNNGTAPPIPEPASLVLLGSGLSAVISRQLKKRRNQRV